MYSNQPNQLIQRARNPYGFPRVGTADDVKQVEPITGRFTRKRKNSLSASVSYKRWNKNGVPLIRKPKRPSSRIIRVIGGEWGKSYNRMRSLVRWDRGGNNGLRWLPAQHDVCKAYCIANRKKRRTPKASNQSLRENIVIGTQPEVEAGWVNMGPGVPWRISRSGNIWAHGHGPSACTVLFRKEVLAWLYVSCMHHAPC